MTFISICIPAYNRASLLPMLLDSIFSQDYKNFEVVISEDNSPGRSEIRTVVRQYNELYADRIVYYENVTNLGYDGNLRRLIELAHGEYVLFMGNDDLLASGALAIVAEAVMKSNNIGVVLRSYDSFTENHLQPVQVFRYFDSERFFPAGAQTIVTFFRRSVFISGMVLRRDSALKYATDRFDGTLLYQQHLVGHILAQENGIYLPNILSHHRLGGIPDFGNSPVEKGKFVPLVQTPESSVHFMRGMLDIAHDLEKGLGMPLFIPILRDIGNYAYPILAIQAQKPKFIFIRYIFALASLGLWRVPYFYLYAIGLLLLGRRNCDVLISIIKRRLGRAPIVGSIYSGQS